MLKRVSYSLWKNYYRSFSADQYDQQTKTIIVQLPDAVQIKWPDNWKRCGNHYTTPGGCLVHVWNTGLAQNYYVEHIKDGSLHRTIHPGVESRHMVLQAVEQIEKIYAAQEVKTNQQKGA